MGPLANVRAYVLNIQCNGWFRDVIAERIFVFRSGYVTEVGLNYLKMELVDR